MFLRVGAMKSVIMKKYLILFLSVLMLSETANSQLNFSQLAGRWESAEGSGLEIVDSTSIFLFYGKDKKAAKFQADLSRNPCWLDLTIEDSSNVHSLKTIFLLVNPNLIQWQVFDDARPENFTADKGEMIYLRRKR
jgi:hypothetical protein